MPDRLHTPQGRQIAWEAVPGAGPTVVFLGGFRSDMTGNKARHLKAWAQDRGPGFVRFDYSGHGQSGGDFTDGCIGHWLADAMAVLDRVEGRVVLVGSSMGGWIALLLARALPARIAGLVTIAAAPDFTEDGKWAGLDPAQRERLEADGVVYLPSAYGDPYPITRRLIEEGRAHLVLRDPLQLTCPVRLLHGTADVDVPQDRSLALLTHATGPDMRLTLVDGADHRFSDARCLALISDTVAEVVDLSGPPEPCR